jgi:hypothetical protein
MFNAPAWAPLLQHASEAELKTRLDRLDQQLNKTYGEVVAKTQKDRVSLVREGQRGYPRHVKPLRDILKVHNWTDANTAILYAYSVWVGSGSRSSEASFLFTLKFDAEGNSKIVKTQQMSDKEVENFND